MIIDEERFKSLIIDSELIVSDETFHYIRNKFVILHIAWYQ